MSHGNPENELREHICSIGKRLYDREMIAANDGNISVRLGDGSFLCTPTGVSKGFMMPDMLCRIDSEGQVVDHGTTRPSSEILMHLHIYKQRPDITAVVHAHPVYATVHAICGKPLVRQIMPEATLLLGEVPIAPYATPSTADLPASITAYLQTHDALLLENHGAVAYGADLQNAQFKMEALEYYARIIYLASQYGGAHEFNAGEIKKLVKLRQTRFNLPGRHPYVDSGDGSLP